MLSADLRDEFYSMTLRRHVIVTALCSRSKFSDGVPLDKAIIADILICNPGVMQKFLESFGRTQQCLNIEDMLYHDNLSTGAAYDRAGFVRTVSLLCYRGLMQVIRQNGELKLRSSLNLFDVETSLIARWKHDVAEIAPLLIAKSEKVLFTHLSPKAHDE